MVQIAQLPLLATMATAFIVSMQVGSTTASVPDWVPSEDDVKHLSSIFADEIFVMRALKEQGLAQRRLEEVTPETPTAADVRAWLDDEANAKHLSSIFADEIFVMRALKEQGLAQRRLEQAEGQAADSIGMWPTNWYTVADFAPITADQAAMTAMRALTEQGMAQRRLRQAEAAAPQDA